MTRETAVQTQQIAKPWYRYKGPWLIMAGPAIVVVAGITTAMIAIHNADDLVADDYYKRGKVVNMDLKRQVAAETLQLSANLMLGDNLRSLRLQMAGNQQFVPPKQLQLRLIHPTRGEQDQLLQLSLTSDNYYQGEAKTQLYGRWHVSIEDTANQWRLTDTWRLDKENVIQIKAIKDRTAQPPIEAPAVSARGKGKSHD